MYLFAESLQDLEKMFKNVTEALYGYVSPFKWKDSLLKLLSAASVSEHVPKMVEFQTGHGVFCFEHASEIDILGVVLDRCGVPMSLWMLGSQRLAGRIMPKISRDPHFNLSAAHCILQGR